MRLKRSFSRSPILKDELSYELTCDQILRIIRDEIPHLVAKGHWVIDGLPCCFFVIVGVKRKHTAEENIDNDPEAPKIYIFAIRSLDQNLWGDI